MPLAALPRIAPDTAGMCAYQLMEPTVGAFQHTPVREVSSSNGASTKAGRTAIKGMARQ
jgi:hypothetical protein